jgi:pilin
VKVKAAPLLAALCTLLLAACTNQDEVARAKVAAAAEAGRQAAQAVGSYRMKRGRFPTHIEEAYVRPAALRDIKLFSVEPRTGVVSVALAFPPLEGKSLLFVPTRKGKSIQWRCTSKDIDPKFLPEACR